jgi:hypothetical protein
MAVARVVAFEGVSADRVETMRREMRDGEPPDDVPAKEIIMLHDADAEKSLVLLFFETYVDFLGGVAALNAMPAEDTPGRRTSATRYEVVVRMSS